MGDEVGQLTSLSDWATPARTTSYQFFADGSLKKATNANGTVTDYAYDNALRLNDVWHQLGAATIDRQTYTMDALGSRTQSAELLAQQGAAPTTATFRYGYDRLSRLTSVVDPGGSTSYAYDPIGNRLTRTRGTATNYTYDRTDRVTAAGGVTYQMNANGNLTSRDSDTFAYDQANRLLSATVVTATTTYAYDGDGKRASATTGGVTTTYVYDVGGGLPVLLDDGARKYVWGLGLAYAADTTGAIEVHHADGLGSVRAVTDSNGAVVQVYDTDEFGVSTRTQGTLAQTFGFAGEQRDATGFSYLRARMYDPALGRFVQRDPFAGVIASPLSLNRFSYVHNNPVNFVDPTGLAAAGSMSSVLKRGMEGLLSALFPADGNDDCQHPLSKLFCIIPGPGVGGTIGLNFGKFGEQPGGSGDDVGKGVARAATGKSSGGRRLIDSLSSIGRAGRAGRAQNVREVVGDARGARALFDDLAIGATVRPHPNVKGGLLAKLEDGTTIGYRPVSGSGPPTVDVHNYPGFPNTEIKFVPK